MERSELRSAQYCKRSRELRPGALGAGALILLLSVSTPLDAAAEGFYRCLNSKDATPTTTLSSAAKHSGTSETFNVSTTSFAPGGSWDRALGTAIVQWNRGPQNFRFSRQGTSTVSRGNTISEIWLSNDDTICGGSAACHVPRYDCANNRIQASDVIFLTSAVSPLLPWTTSESKANNFAYGGSFTNFVSVAIHELGHALGLSHAAGEFGIMNDPYHHVHANGQFATAYPGEDAANGAVRLYGTHPSAGEDLSVSHWQDCGNAPPAGAVDPTTLHCFVQMVDGANGRRLPRSVMRGDVFKYDVRPGQNVGVEFVYENNGRSSHNAEVGFFISTGDAFTASGVNTRRIAGTTVQLDRNAVAVRRHTFNFPTTDQLGRALVVGQTYYVGVVVDENNRVAEVSEDNGSWIPVVIR